MRRVGRADAYLVHREGAEGWESGEVPLGSLPVEMIDEVTVSVALRQQVPNLFCGDCLGCGVAASQVVSLIDLSEISVGVAYDSVGTLGLVRERKEIYHVTDDH